MIYTIEEIRRIITPIAKKYRLPAVYLFGSYARGDATETSDPEQNSNPCSPWGRSIPNLRRRFKNPSTSSLLIL